jgi:beta-glucosidase
MRLTFPTGFEFGTSTSAYQIETPVNHDWLNVRSRDGHWFIKTTDHEKRREQDADIISSLAPNYRMSLMWSKLQPAPFEPFIKDVTEEYHTFLQSLKNRGVNVMMVLHHFANPLWFARQGGWEKSDNILAFIDFAKKLVDEFGHHVSSWNTFNEPNLYASMGWVAGEFPPFKKNLLKAHSVINNLARAHDEIYNYIKMKYPSTRVGISHNCTVFATDNFLGHLPAWFMDLCYMTYASSLFTKTDFFGMSYYARIGHDPMPVSYLTTPKKFKANGKAHDDMWEYYPQGLLECMQRFWKEFRKPIIITENGICTSDDTQRVKAIHDYLILVHRAIEEGIDVRGYYHWSTWDNFEWSLGPTYRFGLYGCDPTTNDRFRKKSADVYSAVAHSRKLDITASH